MQEERWGGPWPRRSLTGALQLGFGPLTVSCTSAASLRLPSLVLQPLHLPDTVRLYPGRQVATSLRRGAGRLGGSILPLAAGREVALFSMYVQQEQSPRVAAFGLVVQWLLRMDQFAVSSLLTCPFYSASDKV